MLSDEAHILLVTDSSSDEDSETDDQSYSPCRGFVTADVLEKGLSRGAIATG